MNQSFRQRNTLKDAYPDSKMARRNEVLSEALFCILGLGVVALLTVVFLITFLESPV